MTIRIQSVDGMPQHDPFTGGDAVTETRLAIDPQSEIVTVYQWRPDYGTTFDEYHSVKLDHGLGGENARPDPDALDKYMRLESTLALLQNIVDGHDTRWDGHNTIGELDANARDALDTLLNEIDALPDSEWTVWNAGDWLHEWTRENITALTTDDEITAYAEKLENEAEKECVIIVDAADYLTSARDSLKKEEDAAK